MGARELRYTWFEELRLKTSADFIATGANKNVQQWTLVLAIVSLIYYVSRIDQSANPLLVVSNSTET